MSSITSTHRHGSSLDHPADLPARSRRSAPVELLAAGCIAMAIVTIWTIDRGPVNRWSEPAAAAEVRKVEPRSAANATAPSTPGTPASAR